MRRHVKAVAIAIFGVLLVGCGLQQPVGETTPTPQAPMTSASATSKAPPNPSESATLAPTDLSTEAGVREYLTGEWELAEASDKGMTARMVIDPDMSVDLTFAAAKTGEVSTHYVGGVSLAWKKNNPPKGPDLVQLQVGGAERAGGEYMLRHRAIVDGKRVMAWFPSSAEQTV